MQLRTATWNIGGGNMLREGEDPTLLASYTDKGLETIAQVLRDSDPDIITIQEAEGNSEANQIAQIAGLLGYEHHVFDPISDSHLDRTKKLGNGIISRLPMSDVRTGRFYNPDIEFDLEGQTARTHDKGYVSCLIDVNGTKIRTTSIHLIPFLRVGIAFDSEIAGRIFASITGELSDRDGHVLIQGDFNIDSETVAQYLPRLFETCGLSEIQLAEPTTPKGRRYDHVLFKNLALTSCHINAGVQTDHYPVTCSFDIV